MVGLLCVGILFIGFGILSIFFKDIAWEMNRFGNELGGRLTERTEAWEVFSTFAGIFCLLFGIFIIYFGINYM